MSTVQDKPGKSFTDGYLDGWHSIRPGNNPAIPAHSIPAGYTPYQWGYEQGREAAQR
jgi:hypothetical protein